VTKRDGVIISTASPLCFGGHAVTWSFGNTSRSRGTLPFSPAVLGRCSVHHPQASVRLLFIQAQPSGGCQQLLLGVKTTRWVNATTRRARTVRSSRLAHPRSTWSPLPSAPRCPYSAKCPWPQIHPPSSRSARHATRVPTLRVSSRLGAAAPSNYVRTAYLADARSNVVRSRLSWCLAACAQSDHWPTSPSHVSHRSSVVVQTRTYG
jgi:hypothetical protein